MSDIDFLTPASHGADRCWTTAVHTAHHADSPLSRRPTSVANSGSHAWVASISLLTRSGAGAAGSVRASDGGVAWGHGGVLEQAPPPGLVQRGRQDGVVPPHTRRGEPPPPEFVVGAVDVSAPEPSEIFGP